MFHVCSSISSSSVLSSFWCLALKYTYPCTDLFSLFPCLSKCGIEKWSYAEGFQFALGQMLGTTFNTFDEPEDYLYVQKSGGKFVLFMLQVA